MKIVRLRANHFRNPLGCNLSDLSLTWVVEDTESKKQESVQVIICRNDRFHSESIIYDSGKCKDADSRSFKPGIKLEPCTCYYWKVRVTGDNGETAESYIATFETGKLNKPWKGIWITPDLDKDIHPYMRKSFEIDGKIKSARVYASAAGIYEMEINGEKISDEYLLPGYSVYDCWMQYQTFDVTEHIKEGKNVIGAILGKGWFSGRFGLGGMEDTYGDRMALLCELVITKEDGSEIVIGTDESWKSKAGPVSKSGIYDGEYYNANDEIADWSMVVCDDESWTNVKIADLKLGDMEERLSPPIIKHESFKSKKIITSKGEIVLDFGQNMAGWVEFNVNIPKDDRVLIQYGELLQKGCFYRDNLRSAKAEYKYISNGKAAHVRPHFTYYGFRYVKVEGIDEVNPEDFTAYAIYSHMDELGEIKTSDERVNRLILNAKWGEKSNFVDIPTDCPQRDERMGWTGDTQVFSGTASFFTDTSAFYNKYMKELREEQKLIDGSVPVIIPRVRNQREVGTGHGSSAWGDVATILPWTVYLYFGDKSMLEKHYGAMNDWVQYIIRQDEEDGGKRLWQTGNHIADWLALDNQDTSDMFNGGTDQYYVATAYYYYSVKLIGDAAEALGKKEDVTYYRKIQKEIKEAFCNEYITPNGKISVDTQTAHILALFMDLLPQKHRSRVAEALKTKLVDKGTHLDTGFVGTPYICRALSSVGANDFAYKLLLNDDFPSWLYSVNMGATTIWERWNSVNQDGSVSSTGMNSMNHYAYGSVVEWIARDICGLNPIFDEPGFKKALIKPKPFAYLKNAYIRYKSVSGTYISSWEMMEDEKINFYFQVPFNCEAEIILPDTKIQDIEIKEGQPVISEQKDGNVILKVEAGKLQISYKPTRDYYPYLSINSSLKDVLENKEGIAILRKYIGGQLDNIKEIPELLDLSLNKPLTANPIFGPLSLLNQEQIEALSVELSKCRVKV
ncbi:glycoside hydrolase family 78 protein [Clostridium sp. SHJSY1]|uniref:alpha-L-rhamnosidase n=1 Tax=Clostridium sp. SHJSY1 TaxID=2942483 RepID=UPI0028760D00|nr:family 78 glycoside hydrolase catalytic domain [Clostridium sp. SHJSY1]MDS0527435.1 glycoside hydrolase family 78 protein [Clostridium sp. SHJSY1]